MFHILNLPVCQAPRHVSQRFGIRSIQLGASFFLLFCRSLEKKLCAWVDQTRKSYFWKYLASGI
jgi:hypothetical protein